MFDTWDFTGFSISMLRLTPFEEYMLLDNHPAYPMSCFIIFRFQGECKKQILRESVRASLLRHPLLACSVEETARGVFCWKPNDQPDVLTFVESEEKLDGACHPSFPVRGIDLFHEPAIKLTLWTATETFLFVEVHHSATDAAGAFLFLNDLLTEYAVRTGSLSEETPRSSFDPNILEQRGKYGQTFCTVVRTFPKQLWGLTRAWMFLRNRPLPLVPFTPDLGRREPAKDFPTMLFKEFSEADTQRIRKRAKEQGVTINDLVLHATFSAMATCRLRWNIPLEHSSGQLRLAVATDLRTPDVANISAANIVSMVFLDRKPKNIHSGHAFLRKIHREMAHIKRCNLGLAFIHGLTIYKKLFGDYRKMINQNRCWTTGTVSNLGRLFAESSFPKTAEGHLRIGSMELLNIYTAPPIRPRSVFGACAATYAGRLTLTLQYDTEALSRPQAKELLDAIRLLEDNGD